MTYTKEKKVEGYNPGSNIKIISCSSFKKLNKEMCSLRNLHFNPMAGGDSFMETAIVKKKIYKYFIIKKEEFRYDLLLELDAIYIFRLEQNCHEKISQAKREKQH